MAKTGNLFRFPLIHAKSLMIKRIVIAVVAASFASSTALSQSTYSRSKSQNQSATPTPTPVQTQSPMRRQKVAPRTNSIPPKPSPSPLQRTTTTTTTLKAIPVHPQPKPIPTQAAIQPRFAATPAPIPVKPTPTPVPPPDVKAYLDRQLANSKDQKFHLTARGKDLPLTPFHFWPQKSSGANSTTTCVDMRSEDGTVFDIDFVTTGAQVTGIRIHRINGEAVR